MPGSIVRVLLPLRFTAPRGVPLVGAGREASGSGATATPVVGVGWNEALPVRRKPPTTWMALAVRLALPLADRAVVEFESTITPPAVVMLALPESVSAPPADGSST